MGGRGWIYHDRALTSNANHVHASTRTQACPGRKQKKKAIMSLQKEEEEPEQTPLRSQQDASDSFV